jgi:hypothetical protein
LINKFEMIRFLMLMSVFMTITGCTSKNTNGFKEIIFEDRGLGNLVEIDKGLVKKWYGDSTYESRFYNYYDLVKLSGKFNPWIIKKTGDDYYALVLLTFNNEGNIIDEYEIAGTDCGGPTELEKKIEFCPYKKAIMKNENEFVIRQVQEYSTDLVNWKVTESDSTEWKIKINDFGKIVETRNK